jgi:hypothetical protein
MEKSNSHNDAKNSLDQLFNLTIQYRSSQAYFDLLNFISKFRFYSPFNAFLIRTQKRGAVYVATAQRWYHDYGHRIKPDAQPIVILQPMGPVMFVFDIADTEPIPDMENGRPIPDHILKPFEVVNGQLMPGRFARLIENAKRDGIRMHFTKEGSCSAGSIQKATSNSGTQLFQSGLDKQKRPVLVEIPIDYELRVNTNSQSDAAQYATIVHELAHLYCGHLGTPDIRLWPDRQNLDDPTREFEAESVSYMVCNRQGIVTTSPEYLANYVRDNDEIPNISMESVMKAAGLIETMSMQKMKLRPERPSQQQSLF